MIKNAVTTILLADGTLTGIVGTNVFPALAPQTTSYPFITVVNNATTPLKLKGSASTNDLYSFEVNIFAETENECQTIANRVRVLIDQYSGTSGGVVVQLITFEDELDDSFVIDREIYARSQEYRARNIRSL